VARRRSPVRARLAPSSVSSFAAAGEVLVTDDTYSRSDLERATEDRRLELRDKREPTDVHVVHVAPAAVSELVAAV
jgi:class 3 adenylate cyclase